MNAGKTGYWEGGGQWGRPRKLPVVNMPQESLATIRVPPRGKLKFLLERAKFSHSLPRSYNKMTQISQCTVRQIPANLLGLTNRTVGQGLLQSMGAFPPLHKVH